MLRKKEIFWSAVSVTRLGYSWKVFDTYSLTKLAQILNNLLCNFKNLSFYVKTTLATFLASLIKIGLLSILVYGHTGHSDKSRQNEPLSTANSKRSKNVILIDISHLGL